jgi:hypothetical protein
MTQVLGKYSFSDIPDVNGNPVMLNDGSTPSMISGTIASRPAFGIVGRLYVSTDDLKIYRDTGSSWVEISPSVSRLVNLYTGETSGTTGTSVLQSDTSTPTSTEGSQIWSQAVTPTSTQSIFKFDQTFFVDSGTNNRNITAALFRNSTCIYAVTSNVPTSGRPMALSLHHIDSPNTTASTTYSLRVGISSGATWGLNRTTSNSISFGTAGSSSWTIMEILL